MKACKQCKVEIPKDAKKCSHCGSKQGMLFFKGCAGLVGFFIVISVFGALIGDDDKEPTPTPIETQAVSVSKEQAQKELADIMSLAKESGLVKSYEFSDRATVVYAGPVWYTQDVAFKKDFLAKVAILKKDVTGYKHFEVRDAYSNEKVAEVTSFGGSLEVYK